MPLEGTVHRPGRVLERLPPPMRLPGGMQVGTASGFGGGGSAYAHTGRRRSVNCSGCPLPLDSASLVHPALSRKGGCQSARQGLRATVSSKASQRSLRGGELEPKCRLLEVLDL